MPRISSQQPLYTQRKTRQSVNGRSQANYDQKLHPADEVMRPSHWARRHGLTPPRNERGDRFYDSETEDDKITLPSGDEEDDENVILDDAPLRRSRSPDPKATRHSQRSAARVRHEYRKNVHPNDDSLPFFGRKSRRSKASQPHRSSTATSSARESLTPASSAVDSCTSLSQVPNKKRKRRAVVAIQISSDHAQTESETESEIDEQANVVDDETDQMFNNVDPDVDRDLIGDLEEPEPAAEDPHTAGPGEENEADFLGPLVDYLARECASEQYDAPIADEYHVDRPASQEYAAPMAKIVPSPGAAQDPPAAITTLEQRSPESPFHPVLAPTQPSANSSPYSRSFKDTTLSLAPPDENTAPSSSPRRSTPFPSSPMADVLRSQERRWVAVNTPGRDTYHATADDDEDRPHQGWRSYEEGASSDGLRGLEEVTSSGGWRKRWGVGPEE